MTTQAQQPGITDTAGSPLAALEDAYRQARDTLIQLARLDINEFASFVLRDEESHKAIDQGPTHRAMQALCTKHRRLILWSYTGAGKTQQVAVARTLWVLMRNPRARVVIISNTKEMAAKIVRTIANYIEHSAEYREVAPAVRPGEPWTQTSLYLRQEDGGFAKDANVQACGIHGNLTGSRADTMIWDDILDPETVKTQNARDDLHSWLKSAAVLGRVTPNDPIWVIGNAYHPNDSLHRLAEEGWHFARLPVLDEHGQSNWPAKWPLSSIEAKRKELGPLEFARQMLCRARDDSEARFRREDLLACAARGRGLTWVRGASDLLGSPWPLPPGALDFVSAQGGSAHNGGADDDRLGASVDADAEASSSASVNTYAPPALAALRTGADGASPARGSRGGQGSGSARAPLSAMADKLFPDSAQLDRMHAPAPVAAMPADPDAPAWLAARQGAPGQLEGGARGAGRGGLGASSRGAGAGGRVLVPSSAAAGSQPTAHMAQHAHPHPVQTGQTGRGSPSAAPVGTPAGQRPAITVEALPAETRELVARAVQASAAPVDPEAWSRTLAGDLCAPGALGDDPVSEPPVPQEVHPSTGSSDSPDNPTAEDLLAGRAGPGSIIAAVTGGRLSLAEGMRALDLARSVERLGAELGDVRDRGADDVQALRVLGATVVVEGGTAAVALFGPGAPVPGLSPVGGGVNPVAVSAQKNLMSESGDEEGSTSSGPGGSAPWVSARARDAALVPILWGGVEWSGDAAPWLDGWAADPGTRHRRESDGYPVHPRTLVGLHRLGVRFYTGVDLAVQRHNAADWTVMFTIAVYPPHGVTQQRTRRVCEIRRGRWYALDIMQNVLDIRRRYGGIMLVENNGTQQYLIDLLTEGGIGLQTEDETPVRQWLHGYTTGRNKASPDFGVEQLAAEFAREQWVWPMAATWHPNAPVPEMIENNWNEILFYDPRQHTGDILMAQWLAKEAARIDEQAVQGPPTINVRAY